MPNVNNGFRLNMTYQGNQVLVDPKQSGIDVATSTTTDQVLDLSQKKTLVAELTTQDLANVKVLKLGSRFITAPDLATLQGIVDQLKNVVIPKLEEVTGRPYDEVAAELGIPVSTLRSRVFYGLKALRVAMEEMGVEP